MSPRPPPCFLSLNYPDDNVKTTRFFILATSRKYLLFESSNAANKYELQITLFSGEDDGVYY